MREPLECLSYGAQGVECYRRYDASECSVRFSELTRIYAISELQDSAMIPVLYMNGTLVSGIQPHVVPIAPAPVTEEAAEVVQVVHASKASSLAVGAPLREGAAVQVLSQLLTLTGQRNTAVVLPELSLKVSGRCRTLNPKPCLVGCIFPLVQNYCLAKYAH